MILAQLAGAALIVAIAAGPMNEPDGAASPRMSFHQKTAALQPLVRSATECIARAVAADPGFRREAPNDNLGDLIVASVPSCITPVRAMIDAYDRYFGEGTGEAFFVGPYLDVLPNAVTRWATDRGD